MESFAKASISRTLRKYDWLLELGRKHKLQPMLLQNITQFLDDIVHTRKEGEQLNVGLVIKNANLKLKQAPIKAPIFYINTSSKFAILKNAVSGDVLCYVIDGKGIVTIRRIPQQLVKGTPSLTLKSVSSAYRTITFCVRKSTIEIFESGSIVRICRKGTWIKPCSMPLEELGARGFPLDLLESVLRWCITLSENETGAVFVITRNDNPSHCSPLTRGYSFEKCKVVQLPESQVLEYASLDGALIMNIKREILCINQRLEPPLTTKHLNEAGRGTRHHAAAMYSDAVDSAVFVVSEDGPISVYFEGNLFARCFEELFGS
jgi:hypothetical protein